MQVHPTCIMFLFLSGFRNDCFKIKTMPYYRSKKGKWLTSLAGQRSWKRRIAPSYRDTFLWAPNEQSSVPRPLGSRRFRRLSPGCRWWWRCASYTREQKRLRHRKEGRGGRGKSHPMHLNTNTDMHIRMRIGMQNHTGMPLTNARVSDCCASSYVHVSPCT